MLDKDQAEAASKALTEEPLRRQRERAEALAAKRERPFPPITWLIVGSLVGLVAGGVAGYMATGDTLPWSIFGLSIGMMIGIGLDQRHR